MTDVCGSGALDPHEGTAFAEIDLYAELVIAAESSPGPLSARQIDEILGVTPQAVDPEVDPT